MIHQSSAGRLTKSPTVRLLIGLLITVVAVIGFCRYSLRQLDGLRKLQTNIIDLNRHDSLLLLRVQNDLDMVGLKLRDIAETTAGHGVAEYKEDFNRLQSDLAESIAEEAKAAPVHRRSEKQAALTKLIQDFRNTSDQAFNAAAQGREHEATELVATQLSKQQGELSTNVSALLERNNEAEERADQEIAAIYDKAQRDLYLFLAGIILLILVTSLYLIYSNRRTFDHLQSLSRQRRVLAARLITVQEEVLRSVSRELHDEFGQILTAVGAMLARAERKGIPPDSPLRTELSEVREITHNTLEKMRSLSQMLHPAVLDDYGLAKGIEWYAEVFQRQAGIQTDVFLKGDPVRITGQPAIHCFRIVQEALTNAAKHSGTKRAQVDLEFSDDSLKVVIQDFGKGSPRQKNGKPGLGLIAMQERAEILGGKLAVSSVPNAGTKISLLMPLRQEEASVETTEEEGLEEVMVQK